MHRSAPTTSPAGCCTSASLQDLSNFPTLTDRLQQGLLNQVVLGRLMLADDGLADDPALARPEGAPIVDNREITYDGNSQGAIMGLALDAIDYPSGEGGLVVWDSGSDPIPFENLAPRTSRDPHEDPRADADVRRQKAAFLFDGRLIDVCDGRACTADQVD